MDSFFRQVDRAGSNEEATNVTCHTLLGEITSSENIMAALQDKLLKIQRMSKDCKPQLLNLVTLKEQLSF